MPHRFGRDIGRIKVQAEGTPDRKAFRACSKYSLPVAYLPTSPETQRQIGICFAVLTRC